VLSCTPVEAVSPSTLKRIEDNFEELFQEDQKTQKDDESLRDTLSFLWRMLRLYRRASRVETDRIGLKERALRSLGQAWSRRTAACPKCGSKRISHIRYGEVGWSPLDIADPSKVPEPGTVWIVGQRDPGDEHVDDLVVVKKSKGDTER
jgi:hypothetical protein